MGGAIQALASGFTWVGEEGQLGREGQHFIFELPIHVLCLFVIFFLIWVTCQTLNLLPVVEIFFARYLFIFSIF